MGSRVDGLVPFGTTVLSSRLLQLENVCRIVRADLKPHRVEETNWSKYLLFEEGEGFPLRLHLAI
jgi:hypothetical protein